MPKVIDGIDYGNWKEELKERLAELENTRAWLSLFLMGIDSQAREDDKLAIDLPKEFVERVEACYEIVRKIIIDMGKWANI